MRPGTIQDAQSIACKLGLLAREIGACAGRLLESQGVTPPEARVLCLLSRGEQTPSALARVMGVDASRLTRLVQGLSRRDVVSRRTDPDNRRQVLLRLTPRGARLAKKVAPHTELIENSIRDALSERELSTLLKAIDKISLALEDAQRREAAG